MKGQTVPRIVIEDAKLLWPNFSGRPDRFSRNEPVPPNTNVTLKKDVADKLRELGVNVREPKIDPDREGLDLDPFVKVRFNYSGRSEPRVTMLMGDPAETPAARMPRQVLDRSTVKLLDTANIISADLVVNTYQAPGSDSTTLYADSAYIFVRPSPLDLKYGMFASDSDDDDIEFV